MVYLIEDDACGGRTVDPFLYLKNIFDNTSIYLALHNKEERISYPLSYSLLSSLHFISRS